MINEEFQYLIESGYEFSTKVQELLSNGYEFSIEKKELLVKFSKIIKYTEKGKCICLEDYKVKTFGGLRIEYTFIKDNVFTYYKRPNLDGEILIMIENHWPNRNSINGDDFKSYFVDLADLREQKINLILDETILY